jgi:formylglycine-generating enzyme required for sulfatase activity
MKKNIIFTIMLLFFSFMLNAQQTIKTPDNFVFIPQGKCMTEDKDVEVHAFYISAYEITNAEYLAYLDYVRKHKGEQAYLDALPDTSAWSGDSFFNDPYVKYYLRHPAYQNYPVVNISYQQALGYCAYLKETLSEDYPDYQLDIRLPTKEEWIRAARGDAHFFYPWDWFKITNEDGNQMCNYKIIGEERIHYDRESGSYIVLMGNAGIIDHMNNAAEITVPVNSYKPNNFGLYNVCGNVAEMIMEEGIAVGGSWRCPGWDVRVESAFLYKKADIDIGFRPLISFVKQ